MDSRLENALKIAKYNNTLSNQKRLLREQVKSKMSYSINGGTFAVTQELISFIDVLIRHEIKEYVIIDSRENPILIKDISEFLDNLLDVYFTESNKFLSEFQELSKARSVSSIVGG